jgi:hypothetical protein
MVGMLQIVTYLLCVYLIFKGVEIYQIAAMSSNAEKQPGGKRLGACMIVIAVICAIAFWYLIDSQAARIAGDVPKLP